MATYNSGTYEIYWHKGTNATPNEPLSPTNEIGTSPRNNNDFIKVSAIAAAGVTVARRAINTARTEISASTGNEKLQTAMNNTMKLAGYGFMVAKGGPIGAALVVADIALQSFTFNKDLARKNREIKLENKLKGKRVNIGQRSVYYD